MAGITLAQAQDKLDLWMAADDAVASGQSYSINNRTLTRTDGAYIKNNIEFWEAKVIKLSRGGGIRITGASPC